MQMKHAHDFVTPFNIKQSKNRRALLNPCFMYRGKTDTDFHTLHTARLSRCFAPNRTLNENE